LPQASTTAQHFDPPPHSVAVLAFTNLSGDPAQEYLSDGLSEELIESLSRIRQVQVTARTSSFYFKGKPATIRDIAEALNVASVVEGSVRRQGNHLRIEARLTDARTGFELWSQPFDSDLGDMLKLEGDIAASVAGALQVKLAAGDAPDLSAGGTADPTALDAYLRGVQNIRHDAIPSYWAALRNFNAAIAAAFAGKANALILLANNENTADLSFDGKMFHESVAAADRAVQLAPQLGSAHIARANVLENSLLDMRGAWNEAAQAEALTPGVATIDLIFSFIAATVGHTDAALQAAHRAIELDPLREDGWLNLGQQLRFARDYAGALKAYQHAETLAGSETPLIGYERALAFIAMGKPQSALDISVKGSDWTHLECTAIAEHALGRSDEAVRTLATLHGMVGDNFPYVLAEVYAQWRQPVDALHWLTKARYQKDSGLSLIKIDPMMDPIRQEPRFKAIEASIDFPD
jgi:TolB-like protein